MYILISDLCRPNNSRSISSSMIKFPDDVRQAEIITGGNPDICADPIFKGKTDEKMDTHFLEHGAECPKTPKSAIKRAHEESSGEPPKKQTRFSLPSFNSDSYEITTPLRAIPAINASKTVPHRPTKSRSSTSDASSANKVSPVRPLSIEMVEKINKKNYQANIRIQPSTEPSPPMNKDKTYRCFHCEDSTNRLNLIIQHYRAHEAHGMNVLKMSPQMPAKITASTPTSSKGNNFSTPKVKNEKNKTPSSKKSNTMSTKKKSLKLETPQPAPTSRSTRTPQSKKKQKRASKAKDSEVDQNKVLREKILKDWDDESDEDENCGSKVFRTVAEIHCSSNDHRTPSPVSPKNESAAPSATESNDTETAVSSTHEMSAETASKEDSVCDEPREDAQTELLQSTTKVEEKEKSCFDFEDNDDAINLDKSHKFGQKLPRVINEEKIRKHVSIGIENVECKTQQSKEDDSAVLENKLQELLEVTEMSEVPELPKSGTWYQKQGRDESDKKQNKLGILSETDNTENSENSSEINIGANEELNAVPSPQSKVGSEMKHDFTDEKDKFKIHDVTGKEKVESDSHEFLTNKTEDQNITSIERMSAEVEKFTKKEADNQEVHMEIEYHSGNENESIKDCKELVVDNVDYPASNKSESVKDNKELVVVKVHSSDTASGNDVKKCSYQSNSENIEQHFDVTTNQEQQSIEKLVDESYLVQKSLKKHESPIEHDEEGDNRDTSNKVGFKQKLIDQKKSDSMAKIPQLDSNLPRLGEDNFVVQRENIIACPEKEVINELEHRSTHTTKVCIEKEETPLMHEKNDIKELTEDKEHEKELVEDDKKNKESTEDEEHDKELVENVKKNNDFAEDEKYIKGTTLDEKNDKELVKKGKKKQLLGKEKCFKRLADEEKKLSEVIDKNVLTDEKVHISEIKVIPQDIFGKQIEENAENVLIDNKGNKGKIEDLSKKSSFPEKSEVGNVLKKAKDGHGGHGGESLKCLQEVQDGENSCLETTVEPIIDIHNQSTQENRKKVTDVIDEIHKAEKTFAKIDTTAESVESEKLWEMEIGNNQSILNKIEGCEELEITQEKDISTGNAFTDFSADFTKNEIEISAVEDADINIPEPMIAEVPADAVIKDKINYLTDVGTDSGEPITKVPSSKVVIEDPSKGAEELKTSGSKSSNETSCREKPPSQKSLSQTEEEATKGKHNSAAPELGTYNNELINDSSDLPEWTAMEYYADLEAQVRSDFDSDATKNFSRKEADDGTVKDSPTKGKVDGQENYSNVINEQDHDALQDTSKGKGDKLAIKKSQTSPYLFEQDNKHSDNSSQKNKSADNTRSGVIYDFKLDCTEQTSGEVPARISKSKKRKWESKAPNNAGVSSCGSFEKKLVGNNLEETDVTEEKNKDFNKIENAPRSEPTEVASKKMKLDLKNEEVLGGKDKESTKTFCHEEMTLSQDTGVVPGEIIISTTETLEHGGESSGKFSDSSISSQKVNESLKAETVIATNREKSEVLSEKKLQSNNPALTEKNESEKKDTSTTFDPSQMELDINSMPVVIEEDLMQDIKFTPVSTVISPSTSTRSNLKQIRIQLRKAGENNSSLLQGTQNGKIIRIPGTSKDTTVINKSQQLAGTSKVQSVSNLIPSRTLSGTGQTMVLKMNAIQGSSVQSKYTVGKSQIRSSTGTVGQPVKLQLISQSQQQNAKLIMHSQQKSLTGKLPRVITKTQTSSASLAGNKTVTTVSKAGQQKFSINQKRQVISNKTIVTKANTMSVSKPTSAIAVQKNTKSVVVTKPGLATQSTKNVVLPAVQGTSGTTTMQVVGQTVPSKVIVQRRTKTISSAVTTVKAVPTQAGTIYIHTSQGLVPASKAVTKQILNQIPQISTPTPPKPSISAVTNVVKKTPMNKSRQASINILQRTQKKARPTAPIQTQVQQTNKAQVLSIPASSLSSHELILNNVPVQLQNIGTTQPADVKMLYLVDERGQYHQVDNSPLIAIDNSGENRSVFIESNPSNEVDNLFLTFGETNVNVSTTAATPTQDILAKALANTQVLQSDTTDMTDSIEGATLYVEPQYPAPTLAHNVLETSFSLNPPIMTPLEVPSSVSPQVSSITSSLIPVSTVETMVKKDVQPSMPLLTDDVEVAAGQTVYLDSSSLVTATTQPLTFQVINSDGNIVVASSSTSSAQTITNPTNGNKTTANQVIFSTDLLKQESRQMGGISRAESIVVSQSDINTEQNENICGEPISLESTQQDTAIPVEANRQIIQTSKSTRTREKRSQRDSLNNERRVKNIVEIENINRQGTSAGVMATTRTLSEEMFKKRLEHDTSTEPKGADEKFDSQHSGSGANIISRVSFTHTIDPAENDSKIVVEEKR